LKAADAQQTTDCWLFIMAKKTGQQRGQQEHERLSEKESEIEREGVREKDSKSNVLNL